MATSPVRDGIRSAGITGTVPPFFATSSPRSSSRSSTCGSFRLQSSTRSLAPSSRGKALHLGLHEVVPQGYARSEPVWRPPLESRSDFVKGSVVRGTRDGQQQNAPSPQRSNPAEKISRRGDGCSTAVTAVLRHVAWGLRRHERWRRALCALSPRRDERVRMSSGGLSFDLMHALHPSDGIFGCVGHAPGTRFPRRVLLSPMSLRIGGWLR